MRNRDNYPIRRVFIIDEISIVMAMAIAPLLRMREQIVNWYGNFGDLYLSVMTTLCMFHIIIYLLYDNRKPSIFVQDPFENFISIIKSRCLLTVLSLIYLYAIQRSVDFSRIIMGIFLALSIAFGYVLRMLYRKHHIKKYGVDGEPKTLELRYPFPDEEDLNKIVNEGRYDDVLVLTQNAPETSLESILSVAEKLGIRTYCSLETLGYEIRAGIVTDVNTYASVPVFVRLDKFSMFGVEYSIARTEEAVLHVIRHLKELSGQYICFSNVHTSVMARESSEYADVLNESAFTFPDGNPIAVLQRKNGILGAERVAGPDFMEHMFRNTADGSISHYFYGASQETLDALKTNLQQKYPGIVIKGMYSPPFRQLTAEEDKADVEMINASEADIIWIGLGAPKQEKWMRAHKGMVRGVMMGVGAGFDFHAGTIKRAPEWVQKIGFEWLYRLFQDPIRLIKRYVITNAKFFWYLVMDFIFKRR